MLKLLIKPSKNKYFLFLIICIFGIFYTYFIYANVSKVDRFNFSEFNNSKIEYLYELESIVSYKNGYNIKGWGKFDNNQFQDFDKQIILLDLMTEEFITIPTGYVNVDENAISEEVIRDTSYFHATVFYKYLIKNHTYQIMILDHNTLINTKKEFTYGET